MSGKKRGLMDPHLLNRHVDIARDGLNQIIAHVSALRDVIERNRHIVLGFESGDVLQAEVTLQGALLLYELYVRRQLPEIFLTVEPSRELSGETALPETGTQTSTFI